MRIAFLLADLRGGGVQRMLLTLLQAAAERGVSTDLLVCSAEGELGVQQANAQVEVLSAGNVIMERWRCWQHAADLRAQLLRPLWSVRHPWKRVVHSTALAEYLARVQPDVLLSATPYLNIMAVLAERRAGSGTRVIVSEHNQFSSGKRRKEWRAVHLAPLLKACYVQADRVVAVSQGVAADLRETADVPREHIDVLYNPLLRPDMARLAAEPVTHPWLTVRDMPVLIAVGRLTEQKDYETLLRAFAIACTRRPLRLIIVGGANTTGAGAEYLAHLQRVVAALGIVERVEFTGFMANPFALMAASDLLVVSSKSEGFSNVLVEALALGVNVVSTDCPSGPGEILRAGEYGALVPVGDANALASAMLNALAAPLPSEKLRARAAAFGFDQSVAAYMALFGVADASESRAMRPSSE